MPSHYSHPKKTEPKLKTANLTSARKMKPMTVNAPAEMAEEYMASKSEPKLKTKTLHSARKMDPLAKAARFHHVKPDGKGGYKK